LARVGRSALDLNNVLYVGLDGSGEVERLGLPSMSAAGRTRLVADSFFGQSHAETIAISPADASVAAASLQYATAEQDTPRRLVQRPAGQFAVSYVPFSSPPSIRLFTSAQLP